MAERRMFAKTIIDSDAFIDMPQSARLLYYDLSMRADDDGFINNPKKIQRMIGASEDDLKLLMAKNFIIPFASGVVVIKHWKIHNYIRNDRYKETVYQEEMALLDVKDNKAYTLKNNLGIPNDNQMDTQVRLGKVRLGKVNKDMPESPNGFDVFWNAYPKKISKGAAEKAWQKLKPNEQLQEVIITAINSQKKTKDWLKDNGQFIPYPSTWLNQKRWEDEIVGSNGTDTPSDEGSADERKYGLWL